VDGVPNYDAFLQKFAALGWAVGICPLADTPFNRLKTNAKWVEYTAVGAAVVATAGTIYDGCSADGCGLLAATGTQWSDALHSLLADEERRLALVAAAQSRLARDYSMAALREQVQGIFREARMRAGARAVPARAALQV